MGVEDSFRLGDALAFRRRFTVTSLNPSSLPLAPSDPLLASASLLTTPNTSTPYLTRRTKARTLR